MKYSLNEYQRALIADALDIAYDGDYLPAIRYNPQSRSYELELKLIDELKVIFSEPIPDQPLWKREPFTEEDRANMLDMMEEEVRDSVKARAVEDLDNITDMVELISYADEDPQVTAELLDAVMEEHTCIEDYETSDFQHHVNAVAFMKRMGLVDPEGRPTKIGIKYLTEYK